MVYKMQVYGFGWEFDHTVSMLRRIIIANVCTTNYTYVQGGRCRGVRCTDTQQSQHWNRIHPLFEGEESSKQHIHFFSQVLSPDKILSFSLEISGYGFC